MVSPHGTDSSRGWKEGISAPATLMRLAAGAGREAQERTSIVRLWGVTVANELGKDSHQLDQTLARSTSRSSECRRDVTHNVTRWGVSGPTSRPPTHRIIFGKPSPISSL